MKLTLRVLSLLAVAGASSAFGQLLFTQYYEGTSNNKWLELTNVGASSIDLTSFSVSQFNNTNTETWKGASPVILATYALTGSLSAGASLVLAHGSAVLPTGITATIPGGSVMNFNGNDSLVLWNDSAAFSTTQIVDALAFTATGGSGSGEGVDKSFVRSNSSIGYSLTAGSDILDFASVWSEVSLATVNAAAAGTNNYLGFSSVSAVPEPSSFAALAGVGALGFCALRRRRSA